MLPSSSAIVFEEKTEIVCFLPFAFCIQKKECKRDDDLDFKTALFPCPLHLIDVCSIFNCAFEVESFFCSVFVIPVFCLILAAIFALQSNSISRHWTMEFLILNGLRISVCVCVCVQRRERWYSGCLAMDHYYGKQDLITRSVLWDSSKVTDESFIKVSECPPLPCSTLDFV